MKVRKIWNKFLDYDQFLKISQVLHLHIYPYNI